MRGELRLHQPGRALGDQRLELDAVDDVERVEDVALGLRHLLAVLVADQAGMYTSRNGTSPVKCRPSMTMRATQKKMMSKPVTRTLVG